jgi:hypothetical protein
MAALTRRRSPDAPEECWRVHYGDVHAGTIAIRTGIPHDEDPWGRSCGFYPGSRPREHQYGTAATFDLARADFEQAWAVFLSNRTEADFQAWRDARDWTARKYALWDAGERLPPNEWEPGKPCSIYLRCPCGDIFNSHRIEENLVHVTRLRSVVRHARPGRSYGAGPRPGCRNHRF